MAKKRADVLLVEQGLISSREKAKRVIMEGNAFYGTQRIDKPGEMIDEKKVLRIKENALEFVSRGGYKLKKMIEKYQMDLQNKVCLDIGASTGGFTDCMLQHGAKKVYAVDVGYNQLDYKLRIDPRVISMERTNIRNLDTCAIEDKIDFISIDVSFISLELVLPIAKRFLQEGGELIALIKPQFEAGRDNVGKGGIVRDSKIHYDVLEKMVFLVKSLSFQILDLTFSPITGTTGNIEFLIYLRNSEEKDKDYSISEVVNTAHNTLK